MKDRQKSNSARVNTSMTPEQKAWMEECAASLNMSVSDFVRQAVLAYMSDTKDGTDAESTEDRDALLTEILTRVSRIEEDLQGLEDADEQSAGDGGAPVEFERLFIKLEHLCASTQMQIGNMQRLNKEMADERMALYRYRNGESKRLATEPFLLSVWRKLVRG